MITQKIIDYLKDKEIPVQDKKQFIEKLNLQYSEIFALKDMFRDYTDVNRLLHSFVYYEDNRFIQKTKGRSRKVKKNSYKPFKPGRN